MTDTLALDAINIRKRFGDVVALRGISMRVRAGSVHALLGENGAGKSTLAKCLTGYFTPDEGQFIVAGRKLISGSPKESLQAGIGMAYQHFTLVPGMTVAENLLLSRSHIPFSINWKEFQREIESRLASMPFRVPLRAHVASLSAGEKQKVEILKQLLLNRRLLILDEPSSALTPQESDDVLGALRRLTKSGALTVVLITHKFREVRQFADDVTILRHGSVVAAGAARALSDQRLAELVMGAPQETAVASPGTRVTTSGARLRISNLRVRGPNGAIAVDGISLSVAKGEILGIAGISGNGQRELVEALAGQRAFQSGTVSVDGEPFARNRAFIRRHRIAILPEEPLRNACVADMSVAENLAMRTYDEAPLASEAQSARWRMRPDRVTAWAQGIIKRNAIHVSGPDSLVNTLSGGNVQRLVLAREIGERSVGLLIAANPCFGLDFSAAKRIRDRICKVRDSGAAILLIGEDIDEVLDIADHVVVMSLGRIVYETARANALRSAIGQAMAGVSARSSLACHQNL